LSSGACENQRRSESGGAATVALAAGVDLTRWR
jgi:hypothetical protein